MVSWASPVPGGMSTTSTSSAFQATSRRSWVMADITMGPRQIMAVSSSTRKPIDMTCTPWPSSGSRMRPEMSRGFRPDRPNSFGPDGP